MIIESLWFSPHHMSTHGPDHLKPFVAARATRIDGVCAYAGHMTLYGIKGRESEPAAALVPPPVISSIRISTLPSILTWTVFGLPFSTSHFAQGCYIA